MDKPLRSLTLPGLPDTYVIPQGEDGKSAYELAVQEGFTGSLDDWLASLKGTPGKDFVIKGYFASLAALEAAVSSPEDGDAYGVGTAAPYDIYVWDAVHAAWVNNGQMQGPAGETGPYYTPAVSEDGTLSWTNNGGLPNPSAVNIKGPRGDAGSPGEPGENGTNGATFTPAVSSDGTLSWTNDKELPNPDSVNITNLVLAKLPTWTGGTF